MTEPARWYHLQGQDQHGPLDLETMRRLVMHGTIRPDTYVWADGMPDWLPAREIPAVTPPADVREHLEHWHGPGGHRGNDGSGGLEGR